MEALVSSSILKQGILKSKLSLSKNPLNPVLSHFVFKFNPGKFTIETSDGKSATRWEASATTEDVFEFTVDGAKFKNLVNHLGSDDAVFIQEDAKTHFKCGKYHLEIASLNIRDFPTLDYPSIDFIDLPLNFTEMLSKVLFSIGNPKVMANFKGLCLDFNRDSKGSLELIATDNVRLTHVKESISSEITPFKIVLSKEIVLEMKTFEPKKIAFVDGKVYLKYVSDQGIALFMTVMRNYNFPNVYKLLDEDYSENIEAILSKKELTDMLKRISSISDKDNKRLKIKINKKKLEVSLLNYKNKSKEYLDIDLDDAHKFNVNLDFFIQYLKNEKESDLKMKIIPQQFMLFSQQNFRHILSIT